MPFEISMPQQSDTMTEGTVVKWRKKEGDKVKAGETLAEIETDKAVMEMESFESGTLAAILVQEGQKVPVGAVIGVIAGAKDDAAAIKKQFASAGAGKGAAGAGEGDSGAGKTGSDKTGASKSGSGAGAGKTDSGAGAGKPTGASAPAGGDTAKSQAPSSAAPAKEAVTPKDAPAGGKPPAPAQKAAPGPSSAPKPTSSPGKYQYDILVIGGGPAGYAAAIRAGQLKKKVLCVEKENLGGICLNWGCIPTKALLEDGAFVRKVRNDAAEHGVIVGEVKIDFAKMIGRSRAIAEKLSKGIASLFSKYDVKSESGTAQLLGPHKVRINGKDGAKEVTADHIVIAVGAKTTQLPGAPFDGKKVITSREAMTLPKQPKRMAIIGAGAIGCEFADFYNAIGTEVVVVELLDHLLPNEDEDVSILLERIFAKRGIEIRTKTRTDKIETTDKGVRLTLSGEKAGTVEADVVLVAVGVTGNVEGLSGPEAKLEIFKSRVKVTPDYRTSLENVWAVGDCIALHWPEHMAMGGYRHPDLAHVAHHEAVHVIEHIVGLRSNGAIDYKQIPGCTYTHPQVASMGFTEKKAREGGREIKVGKFPFSVSGRALAAGERDGFVKLIFDAKYGELLGVHMIGEHVTELLSELVLARKLEATEAEIIEAMHPHPTLSEAVMEAAGVADRRAIHL